VTQVLVLGVLGVPVFFGFLACRRHRRVNKDSNRGLRTGLLQHGDNVSRADSLKQLQLASDPESALSFVYGAARIQSRLRLCACCC
jgi:hypothetical protein